MKKIFLLLLIQCHFLGGIENSIIPLMNYFENSEHLPKQKFSSCQLQEIQTALCEIENKVRIVTYNMLFNLRDAELEEVNRWPYRLPRLVESLKNMQADVIGVQELYESQLQDLLPLLSPYYHFFAKPCLDGEINGIFYKKERFEVIEEKVWYMSETPHKIDSETLTMVHVVDQKTAKEFAIFNTHLAYSNIEKRDFQARFIASILNQYCHIPLVLTGDLNTFPLRLDRENLPFYDGDYIRQLLMQGGVMNSREKALLGQMGPLSTFTNDPSEITVSPFKGTGTPGVFLDHIYVSSKVKVLITGVEPATVNHHYPSDHLPVICDCLMN